MIRIRFRAMPIDSIVAEMSAIRKLHPHASRFRAPMTFVPSHPPFSLAFPGPASYPKDTGRNDSLNPKARRGEPFLLLGEIIMIEQCVALDNAVPPASAARTRGYPLPATGYRLPAKNFGIRCRDNLYFRIKYIAPAHVQPCSYE
jgi:hypothetical protein